MEQLEHFVSCGFLIRSKDKFLFCHPSNLREGVYTGDQGWGIPKGKMDDGEDQFETALRETAEETNLRLVVFPQVKFKLEVFYTTEYLTRFKGKPITKTLVVFYAHEDEGVLQEQPLSCPSLVDGTNIPEMDDFRWVTLSDAKKICAKSMKGFIEHAESVLK